MVCLFIGMIPFKMVYLVIDLAKMLQYLRVTLCIALRVSLLLLHVF